MGENHKKEKRKIPLIGKKKEIFYVETHNEWFIHLWEEYKMSEIFFPRFDYYIQIAFEVFDSRIYQVSNLLHNGGWGGHFLSTFFIIPQQPIIPEE